MIEIDGYANFELISQSPRTLIYRAYSNRLQKRVVIKVMNKEYPTAQEIFRFQNEYEILRHLACDGVPQVIEFGQVGQRRFLVTEDALGISLDKTIDQHGFTIDEFLTLAISTLRILKTVHAKGIVHRDLNPRNIVYNAETKGLRIIDFGLAVHANSLSQPHLGQLIGSLEYLAPEQTGRVNRQIDFRSDIYSLGMTFYHLLTQRLPFAERDTAALVHCHIAKLPMPLRQLRQEIPEMLQDIVNRMIQKSAEDRYQTAHGILKDLETCQISWRNTKAVETFELAKFDVPEKLVIPQKLFGREFEINTLKNQYKAIQNGQLSLAFVSGAPGIGKTALVGEIFELLVESDAYYSQGKFDQYLRDVPFSAIRQAIEGLIARILKQDDASIETWKAKIETLFHDDLGHLTHLIPKVESLIGKHGVSGEMNANERELKMNWILIEFIRLFATKEKPLVLFIDDLQWMDLASYKFLSRLLTENVIRNFLFIGSYRDTEVDASHPLVTITDKIKSEHIAHNFYNLKSLTVENLKAMMYEIFHMPEPVNSQFAQIIFEKTAGNPFFVNQFLRSLNDNKIINYSTERGWRWHRDKTRETNVTNNVIDLLRDKIGSLDATTKKVLKLASCLGDSFSIDDLLLYFDQTENDLFSGLQNNITNGLIAPLDHDRYRFVHDKIHEAAHQTLTPAELSELHYKIGIRSLTEYDKDELSQNIFTVVRHINFGHDQITIATEKVAAANLNYQAAQKAAQSAVFDSALFYANWGLRYLDGNESSETLDLEVDLKIITGSANYALKNYDLAQKIFNEIERKAGTNLKKAEILYQVTLLYHTTTQYAKCLAASFRGLRYLDYRMSKNPNILYVLFYLFYINKKVKRLGYDNIHLLPESKDPKLIQIHALLLAMGASSYFVSKKLFLMMVLKAVDHSLSWGATGVTSNFFTYYSTFLASKLGMTDAAERISVSALKINERIKDDRHYGFALFAYGSMITPWYSSLQKSLEVLEKCFLILKKAGDYVIANFAGLYISAYNLFSGKSLSECEEIAYRYLDYIKRTDDQTSHDSTLTTTMFCRCLQGKVKEPGTFNIEEISEEDFFKRISANETPNPKAWYGLLKMWALYLLGRYHEAMTFESLARIYLTTSGSAYGVILYHFYKCLTLLGLYDSASYFSQLKIRIQVRLGIRKLSKWAKANPVMNDSLHQFLTLEYKRVCKKDFLRIANFEKILKVTRANKQIHIEALINETAAKYFAKEEAQDLALKFARDARACYQIWGAHYKAELLAQQYPELSTVTSATDTNASSTIVESQNVSELLDIQSILKSTNALMSEVHMESLMEKLIYLMIENGGAEYGVLITAENDSLYVSAARNLDDTKTDLTRTLLRDYKNIPIEMINFVKRTLESVVLDDASKENQYTKDTYIHSAKVRSACCFPLLNSGQLKGIVYLENRKASGAFTPDRIEFLKVFSGQAAISIENARLYEEMKHQLRMEGEIRTAQAVQETLFPAGGALKSENVELHGHYEPASECGGDWWSYSEIGDEIYVWLGDATGHGVGAALITSAARSAVALIEKMENMSPAKALSHLNRAIYLSSKGRINMTFFVGALNKKTGRFRYANASHETPVLITKSKITELQKQRPFTASTWREAITPVMGISGIPLGKSEDVPFKEHEIQLHPGDTLMLYTDGLSDQINPEQKIWGERNLLRAYAASALEEGTLEDIKCDLLEKSDEFRQKTPLNDDITFIILRFGNHSDDKKAQEVA